MSDLNFALVLRLIDQVSGPARQIAAAVGGIGQGWAQSGQRALDWNRQATEAHEQRVGALRMEAAETAAMGFALVKVLQPAVQFEDQMARVGAIADANVQELAALSRTARDLGASTAWSARESAEGMENLASAGFASNEIIAAMPGLLALASAGGEGLATTTEIAASTLRGFGLEAAEMGRVADVLTNAAARTNAQVGDLGETMKYVAPIARNAGLSLELTSAMAGVLANNGIKGSMAGTGLAAILQRLQAPAEGAAKILKDLGINVLDGNGNMRDAVAVLSELDAAMAGMGSGERAAVITTLVGSEAAAELQLLLGAARSGELGALANQMKEAGSAMRVAAQVEATTGGGVREFTGALEEMQIAAGTALLPLINDLLGEVTPLVRMFGDWASANPELVGTIAQVAGGLLALKAAGVIVGGAVSVVTGTFLGLHRGIAGTVTAIGWIRTALVAAISFGQGAALAVASAVGAFGGWGAVFAAIGTVITGPVGIAIAVVAALAGAAWLVVRNWDAVKGFMAGVWSGVVSAAQVGWTVIKALVMTFTPLGWIIPNWGTISAWFAALWRVVVGTFDEAVAVVLAALRALKPDWLFSAWSSVASFFSALWAGLVRAASGLGAAIAAAVGGAMSAVWSAIQRAATGEFNIYAFFASLFAGFSWAALIPDLDWRALIGAIDWRWFIPVVGWVLLLGRLNWRAIIPVINWRAWIPASWAGLVPRWNWSAIIPRINIGQFISGIGGGGAPAGAASGGVSTLQRRASGGAFAPGPLLVGELGPEIYYPDEGGFIAHHRQLQVLAGLSGQIALRPPPLALLPTGPGALRPSRQRPVGERGPGRASLPAPVTLAGDLIIQAAPGQDPRAIAEAVMQMLDARAAQARRTALHDLETGEDDG